MDDDGRLRLFTYDYLPKDLQRAAIPFYEFAVGLVNNVPPGNERTVALRKLLEARDAVVRATAHPGY